MKTITAFSAAALLAASVSLAAAQGTSQTTPNSGMMNNSNNTQCWDVSSNMVRNKDMKADAKGTTTGSAGSKATSGSDQTAAGAKSGNPSTSTMVRPAGMPNC